MDCFVALLLAKTKPTIQAIIASEPLAKRGNLSELEGLYNGYNFYFYFHINYSHNSQALNSDGLLRRFAPRNDGKYYICFAIK